MKILKISLFCVMFMILSVSVLANTVSLADYPVLFVEKGSDRPYIVVGDMAPAQDVVTAMGIALTLQFEMNKNDLLFRPAKLASQVDDIYKRNLIIVGTKDDNKLVGKLVNLNLKPGEGIIKFLNKGSKYQIIVSGHTPRDTEAAAKVLNRFRNYEPLFFGDTIYVRNGKAYTEDGREIGFDVRPLIPELHLPPNFGRVQAPTVQIDPSVMPTFNLPERTIKPEIKPLVQDKQLVSNNEFVVQYVGLNKPQVNIQTRTYVI